MVVARDVAPVIVAFRYYQVPLYDKRRKQKLQTNPGASTNVVFRKRTVKYVRLTRMPGSPCERKFAIILQESGSPVENSYNSFCDVRVLEQMAGPLRIFEVAISC